MPFWFDPDPARRENSILMPAPLFASVACSLELAVTVIDSLYPLIIARVPQAEVLWHGLCMHEKDWERVLWKRTPYPDNYVPRAFLSSLTKNRELAL